MPAATVKHIVVLMMENRSFDHLLGLLKRENPAIRGALPGEYANSTTAWSIGRDLDRVPAARDNS